MRRSSPRRARCPRPRSDLAAIKEFTGRASRGQLDRWFDAIQAGIADPNPPALRVPSEGPPPPRVWVDRNPEADRRLKAARAAVGEKADELDLPVENLLTPEIAAPRRVDTRRSPLTAEAVGDALEALGARPWQRDATAQLIADAFVEAEFVEPDQTAPDADPPAS